MEKKTGGSMTNGFGGKFGKYNGDEIKYVKKFFNTENKKTNQ